MPISVHPGATGYEVDVVIDGQRHQGRYTIDNGQSVTVWLLPMGISKSRQIGNGDFTQLVPRLLRELVADTQDVLGALFRQGPS